MNTLIDVFFEASVLECLNRHTGWRANTRSRTVSSLARHALGWDLKPCTQGVDYTHTMRFDGVLARIKLCQHGMPVDRAGKLSDEVVLETAANIDNMHECYCKHARDSAGQTGWRTDWPNDGWVEFVYGPAPDCKQCKNTGFCY